jgi:hypothetical protein
MSALSEQWLSSMPVESILEYTSSPVRHILTGFAVCLMPALSVALAKWAAGVRELICERIWHGVCAPRVEGGQEMFRG